MELIGVLVLLVATGWVYSDAKDRGSSSPGLWALGTFLLLIVFFPLYLFMRPSKRQSASALICPYCGKYYNGTPAFCPNCGHSLATTK